SYVCDLVPSYSVILCASPSLFPPPPPSKPSTLSLHDALPIFAIVVDELVSPRPDAVVGDSVVVDLPVHPVPVVHRLRPVVRLGLDRESTRLNSSHVKNSYAVFCLK